MHHKRDAIIKIGLFCCLMIFYSNGANPAPLNASERLDPFESVQKALIQSGYDRNQIQTLYRRSEVGFDVKVVTQFFLHSESKVNYDQFLYPEIILKAKEYMNTQRNELIKAKNAYGVEAEFITAILLVETRLGEYLGNRRVLNTLSSISSLSDSKVRNAIWNQIYGNSKYTQEEFLTQAMRKSAWAFNELQAFLDYVEIEQIDPVNIVGSFAGAMGICQFMPSNILRFATDGNYDGRINLFQHADAITSAANYLKAYGWYPGIKGKKRYNVLYAYNHSRYYVDTLIKIAELVKGYE